MTLERFDRILKARCCGEERQPVGQQNIENIDQIEPVANRAIDQLSQLGLELPGDSWAYRRWINQRRMGIDHFMPPEVTGKGTVRCAGTKEAPRHLVSLGLRSIWYLLPCGKARYDSRPVPGRWRGLDRGRGR